VPSLTLSVTKVSTTADLTAIGTLDWAEWGYAGATSTTPSNTKSGGGSLISLAIYGGGSISNFTDSIRLVGWSDGTPTASEAGTASGLFNGTGGDGQGWQVTFPADTTLREAYVYLGTFDAGATIEAVLSDSSAGPGSDSTTLAIDAGNPIAGFAKITYAAATAGQSLFLRQSRIAGGGGNMTIQAAALKLVPGGSPATRIAFRGHWGRSRTRYGL
jgi:hypothetical protein